MSNKKSNLWFKRRRYGWGWTPVSWQGFITIGLFLAVVLTAAFQLPADVDPTPGQLFIFFGILIVSVAGLAAVGFVKGPAPRWRWGKKPGDNPDEDF